MFPHCSHDLICFANLFKSNSGWHNVERIFRAVHLPAVILKIKSRTAKEVLRNSAADKASNWIDLNVHMVGNEMECFLIETSGTTSSEEVGSAMKRGRANLSRRKKRKWKRATTENAKRRTVVRKQINGKHSTKMYCIMTYRNIVLDEEKYSSFIKFSLTVFLKTVFFTRGVFHKCLVQEDCRNNFFSKGFRAITCTTCTRLSTCSTTSTCRAASLQSCVSGKCFYSLWLRKDRRSSAFHAAPSTSLWMREVDKLTSTSLR